MRGRLILWGGAVGVVALIVVIAIGLYVGYSWYNQRYGDTPERALRDYFAALGDADYDVMYKMTPDADLMVLGRKLSQRDFANQVGELLGGEEMEMEEIQLHRIAQQGEYYYFRVGLHYQLGEIGRVTYLLVETKREGQQWKVTYPFTPSL